MYQRVDLSTQKSSLREYIRGGIPDCLWGKKKNQKKKTKEKNIPKYGRFNLRGLTLCYQKCSYFIRTCESRSLGQKFRMCF